MSSRYNPTTTMQIVDRVLVELLGAGVPIPKIHLLATKGWRSGKIRLTPVTPMTDGNQRWLVAPYGESGWVKNLRKNPRLQLRHGSEVIYGQAMATSDEEAGAILKQYLAEVPLVRSMSMFRTMRRWKRSSSTRNAIQSFALSKEATIASRGPGIPRTALRSTALRTHERRRSC